jgi:four helix bundle protein
MAEQAKNRGFEDLKAWQLARQLMNECHQLADGLPAKERYDLASQIRRSSKSVMANIAEGYGRYHYLDRLRFFYFARGSLNETVNHVITASDLSYVDAPRARELYELGREAERTLNGYINHVRRQKEGSEAYGTKYIPAPGETLESSAE